MNPSGIWVSAEISHSIISTNKQNMFQRTNIMIQKHFQDERLSLYQMMHLKLVKKSRV